MPYYQDGCCRPGVLEAAGLAGWQGESAGQGANVVSAPCGCPTNKMFAAGVESSRPQAWLAGIGEDWWLGGMVDQWIGGLVIGEFVDEWVGGWVIGG